MRNPKITFVIICLLTVCLLSSALAGCGKTPDRVADILAGMTTEDKVAQMLMPAFRYQTGPDGKLTGIEEITPAISAKLEKYGFAGAIFFAQNTVDSRKTAVMIDAMQKANALKPGRTQLLCAIDQEGGPVARLGHGCRLPGNMTLGAAGDEESVKKIANVIAEELTALGFNYDAAPVLDVNSNPSNPVIGLRSFSDDPKTVSRFGVIFMKELQKAGIVATLKHFPGHGDTDTDTHTGLASVDRSLDELKVRELVPFQACIDAGAEAIMTAHIEYPQIETQTVISKASGEPIHLPATLSKKIMTGLLREEMGFNGVIITDAMNMDAIAKHFDPLEAAKLAINAGVDIILMPVDLSTDEGMKALDDYIAALCAMVEKGDIPLERINESAGRVLKLKEKHGLLDPYAGSPSDVSSVGGKAHHDIEAEVVKKALTLLKNESGLPLPSDGKISIVVPFSSQVQSVAYAIDNLKENGILKTDADVRILHTGTVSAEDLKRAAAESERTVLVSALYEKKELNPTTEDGATGALYDQLIEEAHQAGKKVVLLSAQLPYDAARFQKADAIVLCYYASGMSEDPRKAEGSPAQYGPNIPAAVECLFTPDHVYTGRLPLDLPALTDDWDYSDTVLYSRLSGLDR